MKGKLVRLLLVGAVSLSLFLPAWPSIPGSGLMDVVQAQESVPNETGVALGNYTDVVKVTDTFDQSRVREDYLRGVRDIRTKAYNENWPFNGKPLQTYLHERGIDSLEAYVSMVQWDKGLEMIAIQRAYETQVHSALNHIRATGEQIWTATYNGGRFFAENLSWTKNTYIGTYNGWGLGEVEHLKTANGQPNSKNGHLHTLLDPQYIYHGAGITSRLTLAGAYSSSPIEAGASGWTGEHTVSVGVSVFTDVSTGKSTQIQSSSPVHKVEEGAVPDPVYEDTTDLYEGETRTKSDGTPARTEYDLVEKSFTGIGATAGYTGAATSYLIGTTKTNVQEIPGTAPVILRGTAKKVTEAERIPFETSRQADHTMFVSDGDRIATAGEDGAVEKTYKVYEKDGQTVKELLDEKRTKEPVTQIVHYGTLDKKTVEETNEIPYKVTYIKDGSLKKGESVTVTKGVKGARTTSYEIIFDTAADNKVVEKKVLSSNVTKEPVTEVIRVGSLEYKTVEEFEDIPFSTVDKESGDLFVGETKLIPGQKGQKKLIYKVTLVDGQETDRVRTGAEIVKEPVDAVQLTGTKKHVAALIPEKSSVGDEQNLLERNREAVMYIDGNPESLQSISLDDTPLTPEKDYTVKKGSTIITLTPDLMGRIALGTHKLTAVFSEDDTYEAGTVTALFTVREEAEAKPDPGKENVDKGTGAAGAVSGADDKDGAKSVKEDKNDKGKTDKAAPAKKAEKVKKSDTPKTGDTGAGILWLGVVTASAAGVYAAGRKRKENR